MKYLLPYLKLVKKLLMGSVVLCWEICEICPIEPTAPISAYCLKPDTVSSDNCTFLSAKSRIARFNNPTIPNHLNCKKNAFKYYLVKKEWLSLWFEYCVADPQSYITMFSIGDANSWREFIYATLYYILFYIDLNNFK